MLAHAHVTHTPTCASTCTCTFTCLQSEWDLASGRAPDYAGVMASLATDALGSRPRGDRRVLMLGLGGGTIAADIMLVHAPLRGTGPGPSHEVAYRSGRPSSRVL